MATVIFEGCIFPSVLKLTCSQPIILGWRGHPSLADCEVEITIADGDISVKCEIEKFEKDQNLAALFKEVVELSGTVTSILAFASGDGTTIVFEKMTLPNDATTTIRLSDNSLAIHCTAYKLSGASIFQILELAMREPLLHYALRDLNETLTSPNRTPLNCARVIETIRFLILPQEVDEDRTPAWTKMREELNLTLDYIKFISKPALSHRHGAFEHVDGKTNTEISHRTWQAMNRFLAYRLRGNQRLRAPEFPPL